MKQQTLQADAGSEILLESISGDLRVAGWERNEIMLKTDGDELGLEASENKVCIKCDDDLILYLPSQASLIVENVAGDASFQALKGQVSIINIGGDLVLKDVKNTILKNCAGDVSLRNTGKTNFENIAGDLNLRQGKGDCLVQSISGDISLRDLQGEFQLEDGQADLFARNISGPVRANVQGNATLSLVPENGLEYRVDTAGDLLLHLPSNADVELHLAVTEAESLHVDIPGVKLDGESPTQKIILGKGSARMYLTASGSLIVTCKSEDWDSAADFGVGMLDGLLDDFSIPPIPPIHPFPNLPSDLSERINQKVQRAMERVQGRTDGLSHRAAERVEAAMRRAEAKARAAEVRARRGHASGRVIIGGTEMFTFNTEKKPKVEPVSDAERLTILRMLQEKKISVTDAENLLAALEGKGE